MERDPHTGLPKPTPSRAFLETVQEITTIYKSLPPRPSVEEVEAATSALETANNEENSRLAEIESQLEMAPQGVPPELFSVLKELRKTVVVFQCHRRREEALRLLQLDDMFAKFGDLIQRASELVSGGHDKRKQNKVPDFAGERLVMIKEEGEDQGEEEEEEQQVEKGSSVKPFVSAGDGSSEKLSLMKLATLIESCARSGTTKLDLRGKLMDETEWLPVSIGKLSDVTQMDLSENRIMALPATIAGLKALTKLSLHSNQLINLPQSFGELVNLVDLDLHANRLKSLPASFGNLTSLVDLNLSSNEFTNLPDVIGDLSGLKRLNVDTNKLEELPHTIGNCSSLCELRLDFNELKALPEAIGKLEWLEILTLHYNRVKRLPSTIGNLRNLKELDVSFNEIEFVPENLCLAVSLKKLNLGKNFADLRALPKSIGQLEMLEELDISDDQIRALPESFMFLSKLRVFRADETPLEVPPREVVKLGAQEVVQYMADFVAGREAKVVLSKKKKKKGFWVWFCSVFCPHQR